MTALLIIFFLSLIVLTAIAQGGRDVCDMHNRCSWLMFFCGLTVAYMVAARNPWAGVCIALVIVGTMTTAPWSQTWQRSGYPALAAASAYLALTPIITQALIVPVLWTFVAVGCWAGAWTIFSSWKGKTPYQIVWGKFLGTTERPIFCWHEDSPTHLKAGQGNANHLQGVALLCLAAVAGLCWLGFVWAALALPVVAQPLIQRVNKEGVLSQAHVHLASLGVAWLALQVSTGASATALLAVYGGALMVAVKPWRPRPLGQIDGGRFALWRLVIAQCWWPLGWRQRLMGVGTGTWEPLTAEATTRQLQGIVFTTAHNEYVQWLVEHGMIGVLFLAGYLTDALARLWQGGPLGQAMFLMAITLCSMAVTNFPWTWFHEIAQPPSCTKCEKKAGPSGVPVPEHLCQCPEPRTLRPSWPLYVGSPTLVAMSLVIALLTEAF